VGGVVFSLYSDTLYRFSDIIFSWSYVIYSFGLSVFFCFFFLFKDEGKEEESTLILCPSLDLTYLHLLYL